MNKKIEDKLVNRIIEWVNKWHSHYEPQDISAMYSQLHKLYKDLIEEAVKEERNNLTK